MATLPNLERLLRDPLSIVDDSETDQASRARFLVMVILIAGAAFGAAIGLGRGGLQVPLAALKLPLALLFAAAICAPCLTAFNYAFERPHDLRRDILVVLAVLALEALVVAATVPIVLLALAYKADYHAQIMVAVVCYGVAGLVGLRLLLRGLGDAPRKGLVAVAVVGVFGLVSAQMAWTLRPFVVRPRSEIVVFRSLESSFVESVMTSARSAAGIYRSDSQGSGNAYD
jgi:hypothetical protein